VTSSSEARVPHDPKDLRLAAWACGWSRHTPPGDRAWLGLKARLEAWADLAPLEAAVLDAVGPVVNSHWFQARSEGAAKVLADAVRALQEATDA
jgi:hypothetical protein